MPAWMWNYWIAWSGIKWISWEICWVVNVNSHGNASEGKFSGFVNVNLTYGEFP